jgi:IclR family transcriptional regulator, KDG regulon repressor
MSEVQSLARGLQIIEKLAQSKESLSITELADEYGVDKGSISRMMQTLANYGFAEREQDSRKYILGPQVVRLSRMLLLRTPLRDTAKSYLKQLVQLTGECAHLAILAQAQALYIDQEESPYDLRVTTGIGTLAPLHCTALGKIFLGFAGVPIKQELTAFTLRTITDLVMLERHLDIVRTQGYAVDDEEYNPGVRCIAVPIFDYRGKCVAAIGVSGPTSRLSLEQMQTVASVVVQVGKSLTAKLSFQ